MMNRSSKFTLVAAFIAGLGPYLVVPAHAVDWYEPGDPTQHDIERLDSNRDATDLDIYGTD